MKLHIRTRSTNVDYSWLGQAPERSPNAKIAPRMDSTRSGLIFEKTQTSWYLRINALPTERKDYAGTAIRNTVEFSGDAAEGRLDDHDRDVVLRIIQDWLKHFEPTTTRSSLAFALDKHLSEELVAQFATKPQGTEGDASPTLESVIRLEDLTGELAPVDSATTDEFTEVKRVIGGIENPTNRTLALDKLQAHLNAAEPHLFAYLNSVAEDENEGLFEEFGLDESASAILLKTGDESFAELEKKKPLPVSLPPEPIETPSHSVTAPILAAVVITLIIAVAVGVALNKNGNQTDTVKQEKVIKDSN